MISQNRSGLASYYLADAHSGVLNRRAGAQVHREGMFAVRLSILTIRGILIDLLTYLTNLSDDMKQKNVPDDDWKPIVTAFVGQCVKAIERALPTVSSQGVG